MSWRSKALSLLWLFPLQGCLEAQISLHSHLQGGRENDDTPKPNPTGEDESANRPWKLDSAGWTSLQPATDSKVIFVSSTLGADTNDGLSPERPLKTLAAARAKMRNGMPDWLKLREGDTFNESLGPWTLSGESAENPMVVTSYCESNRSDCGTRPLIRSDLALEIKDEAGADPLGRHDLAFVGLAFAPSTYTGGASCATGIRVNAVHGEHLLFEDCFVRGFAFNVNIVGGGPKVDGKSPLKEVALRRSIVVDAYVAGANSCTSYGQGVRVGNVNGFLLEQNLIDHNGWRDDVPNAFRTGESHNIHLSESNEPDAEHACEVRGNIISNAGSDGLQARCNGMNVVEDNLFVRNSIGLTGIRDYTYYSSPVVWRASIQRNVFLEGTDINRDSPSGYRTWAIVLNPPFVGETKSVLKSNIVAHRIRTTPLTNNAQAINCNGSGGAQYMGAPVRCLDSMEIDSNVVFDWEPGTRIDGGAVVPAAPASTYVDPARSMSSYMTSIGMSSADPLQSYVAEARKQSRHLWRSAYTAQPVLVHVRAGFEPR